MIDWTKLGIVAPLNAMIVHAEAEWPRESVGIVDRRGVYHRLRNVADDPETSYVLDEIPEDAVAVAHSHPSGQRWPSRQDMECQIESGMRHYIVTLDPDGVAVELPFHWPDPLWSYLSRHDGYLGRPYRHGVTDCYALIRDWYAHERGIETPALAYDWRWDESDPGLDLYRHWARRLGWSSVDPAEARPGDLALMSFSGSGVANHAGIVLEEGMVLHHPSSRPYDLTSLSRREPLNRLARRIVDVVRPAEAA